MQYRNGAFREMQAFKPPTPTQNRQLQRLQSVLCRRRPTQPYLAYLSLTTQPTWLARSALQASTQLARRRKHILPVPCRSPIGARVPWTVSRDCMDMPTDRQHSLVGQWVR